MIQMAYRPLQAHIKIRYQYVVNIAQTKTLSQTNIRKTEII